MKNKILLIIGLIILTSLTGCKGKEIKSDDEWSYTVVINEGSDFIYTITDSETGVNYIVTKYGITPRLNADGSIHLTNKEILGKNK